MNVSNQQIISNSAFWSNHWPNHNLVPNHDVPVSQCTCIQLIVTAKPVNPCMAKLYILVYWYIEHSLWCIFLTENLYISLEFILKGPFHHKSILVTSHYLNKHWPKCLTSYGVNKPHWVNTMSAYCFVSLHHQVVSSNEFDFSSLACSCLSTTFAASMSNNTVKPLI